ncbi:hypothetical protein D8I30_10810 [Brevundimonas naejangsanensis]|uniref:Uncharacterized protein n=1 Tax=Brevundimonas naejangsanensis TaxID=588932 RepID=A0A494RGR4_9CAUL|nr:hypothetical protein D8I30_10810 [Brevundimonas naejangsanensis]
MPAWKGEAASGQLLTELIKYRPDWREVLLYLDSRMPTTVAGRQARAYLRDWADGHFLDAPFPEDPHALRARLRRA